jgi:hypothetical protein
MDVVQLCRSIEHYHGVTVTLVMSPDGLSGFSHLKVTAVATRKMPTSLEARRSVSRSRVFPSNDAVTLEGLMFRLVNELDNDCSAMWEQSLLVK